jgi:hypothetical protein
MAERSSRRLTFQVYLDYTFDRVRGPKLAQVYELLVRIAAIFLGALAVLNEVLPVIPFLWRLVFVVALMLVVADLCLRSVFIDPELPSLPGVGCRRLKGSI